MQRNRKMTHTIYALQRNYDEIQSPALLSAFLDCLATLLRNCPESTIFAQKLGMWLSVRGWVLVYFTEFLSPSPLKEEEEVWG